MDYNSNIWKLYLFNFLLKLHFFGAVLVPFFTDWGGISFTKVMILQSVFMLGIFLLEVPTGAVADHWGRKQSMVIGALMAAAGFYTYTITPNFYVFLAAELLLAAAYTLRSGAMDALLYDTLKELGREKDSKKMFGRLKSTEILGYAVAAPFGSVMAASFGLDFPMLMTIIPVLSAALIAVSFKEPEKVDDQENYFTTLVEGMRYFRGNRILKLLAFDYVSIGVLAYFILWLNQPMLIQAGLDLSFFGFVITGLAAGQLLVMNNYRPMEKLLGSKRIFLFISAAMMGALYILGGLTNSIAVTIIVIVIAGGFGLGRTPLFTSYMNKYIPSNKRATVLSTVSMMHMFILVILNPLVGMMVDASLDTTLIVLGALAILFALISRVEEEHLID